MKYDRFAPGISIVLPTYNNSETLPRALRSLEEQTLSKELFEVVVVLNGAYGSSEELLRRPSDLNLRVFKSSKTGAGRARNLGLSVVKRSHVTFLDDDDRFEPRFLEAAWNVVREGTGALLGIREEDVNGKTVPSSLNARIKMLSGSSAEVCTIPWALGFNACKVVPAGIQTLYRYSEALGSGEDVAFFASLLKHPNLKFAVPKLENSNYIRSIRANSVSRRERSFDFNVAQRLDVIGSLQSLELAEEADAAASSLISSQFRFVEDYLADHADEVQKAAQYSALAGVVGLEINKLNPEPATRAVFSYCFPPYADTAGNVAAKRIRESGELVDVYSATMDRVRLVDRSSLLMVEPFIRNHRVISTVPSFSDWNAITDWAKKASRQAAKQGHYDSIYSRSMWSASHVAALLYKRKFPHVRWTAEFSDPMRVDAQGHLRLGKITAGLVTRELKKMAHRAGMPKGNTHFDLTEALTMYYADELVFTNRNQRDFMMSFYKKEDQETFLKKSIVRSQLKPDAGLYELVEANYPLDREEINIGYFGSFYKNRGIGEVAIALESLPQHERQKLHLHVFTPDPNSAGANLKVMAPRARVTVNRGLPYLEFLNLATKLDVLVVNDVDVNGTELPTNPFLPSKYSDYIGAGTNVWGIVADGSPLAELSMKYRSRTGDSESIKDVLLALASRDK